LFILAKDLLAEAMVNKESPGVPGLLRRSHAYLGDQGGTRRSDIVLRRGLRPAAAGEAQLKQFMKYD
jgi:hypothetical protein